MKRQVEKYIMDDFFYTSIDDLIRELEIIKSDYPDAEDIYIEGDWNDGQFSPILVITSKHPKDYGDKKYLLDTKIEQLQLDLLTLIEERESMDL